ncbi:MAG: dTDP-4-dehydrorhamnose reductase [Chlamydiales bacterium 38-26]|nr:dTDP-4-dehydrorhamnose reductase [Chlamydiales bacterium]OJV11542.1 MAG: dTDP-4-dehydrorhamnose reductase [Chlamydiales bacterium 38-26]
MKKILILGSKGQVGWELQRTLAPLGQIIAHDRTTLDLSCATSLSRKIQEIQPQVIVNAAAYTAVDKAETDQETCYAINAKAPQQLAQEAKKLQALLIHYSTDYVFDGKSAHPYKEQDSTNPQNIYAKSKLEGDQAILSSGCSHIILRTSWVYGSRGQNFLRTMLRLGQQKDLLKIVDDQIGAPTWSRLIAEATAQVIARYNGQDGLYNLTSGGKTSWFGFAQAIFDLYSSKNEYKVPQLNNIPSSEYPVPAKRPQNSLLCQDKLFQTFQIKMPDWKDALEMCIEEMVV